VAVAARKRRGMRMRGRVEAGGMAPGGVAGDGEDVWLVGLGSLWDLAVSVSSLTGFME
jgi:hypothetical protein